MADNTRFHFTKILVTDVHAQFSFYSSVLGMVEEYRVAHGEGDEALEEIIMASAHGGDPSLVLLHYLNRAKPVPGEAVLGFSVRDVETAARAAEVAGGRVMRPPKEMPEFDISMAYVQDPEGHLLELVQHW